jgi:pimeloyl-ACP methyl ester carboxylesterase
MSVSTHPQDPTPPRAVTPARMVALAVIGLVVVGLLAVRLDSGDDVVSVPKGAKAGDLTLKACTYATEEGSYAADCGTLVVPENRHDAESRLIALPVTRVRAQAPNGKPPLFYFEGGPGITNMEFPETSRFADDRDVVLVGYRGIDGSVRLDCPEVVSSRLRSRDWLSTASLESDAAAMRACAARFGEEGVDLAGYTLPQRIDDIELARRKLGYGKIDLVGESFGTRVALVYAWRHPQSVHRMLVVGVNPPGHFLWDAQTADEQLRRYAALCAEDASCSARTDDLAASVHSAFERMPGRWGFLPIKKGIIRSTALFGLVNATPEGGGPFAAPLTLDMLLSLDEGDASGAWLSSVLVQAMIPRFQLAGDHAAMGLSDAAYARRFFASPADHGSKLGSAPTEFGWGGGRLVDAWPVSADHALYDRVPHSEVETLLVGGELDFSTPPQVATRELLPHLPNGQEVVFPKLGHTEDFWTYQPQASTRLITTYLDTGRVDTTLYIENRVDFTPSMTYGALAKIVLGVMLGLAALTVLSLAWMALRVRRRGAFGRKTSGVLRSVYALVLGLGGLVLGMLIVLTALPTVPIGDELLTTLSIGVPVGLGLYLAWVNRDWSGTTKAIGFAAAAGGALVGGWLGFNATEGGLPLLSAIAGAAVGGNLGLLTLDVAADWRARHRAVATLETETLAARPATG